MKHLLVVGIAMAVSCGVAKEQPSPSTPSPAEAPAKAPTTPPAVEVTPAKAPTPPSAPAASSGELLAAPETSSPTGLTSTPLFECSDVNFAWGVEFHGFVVDDAGRIWSYDRAKGHPARDVMWNPKPAAHDAGYFDGATLRAKFLLAESHVQVPVASVQERAALATRARAGKVSSKHVAYDAGGHGCVAYVWNAAKTAYESVELGSEGDAEVKNSAPEAGELAKWLATIERELRAASPTPH